MTYIVECSCPDEYEYTVTLFVSEKDALSQACFDMMNVLTDHLNLSEEQDYEAAEEINGLIDSGDYRGALRVWNDAQTTIYWHVYEKPCIIGAQKPNSILLGPFQSDEDEEDEKEVEAVPPTSPSAFMATTPGATCRGPCGNHNPDAYADRSDGTHVCYQCKYMSQVFGSKDP
jgi:hypothetical protein